MSVAEAITVRCQEAGFDFAQLHGDTARSALQKLPLQLQVVYVVHADADGSVQTSLPDPFDRLVSVCIWG